MPNYYDLSLQKAVKKRHKFRRIILYALLLSLLAAVALAVYFYFDHRASKPVVIKPFTQTVYNGSPKHVIQSDRFSFESTGAWQFSPELSSGSNRYVYFTQSNNLIEYQLSITFSKSLEGKSVNYVVPVTVSNNRLVSQVMSPRCGDKLIRQPGTPPNTLTMQYQGANYLCLVRGSGEKAAAALVGGSYDIPMTTPKHESVTVNFTFDNDSSSYFGQVFQGVLDSFTLK